jgi:carbon monoxide dehydrogenase subunit G
MDMTGERRISAPPEAVWAALNDPAILRAAIPGCESLEKESDTAMQAVVAMKIGPISAKFTGTVQLLDLDPPTFCRIAGEGQGGVAGFAKGEAIVILQADGAETLLKYAVHAQVGGKMAQLGARLIDASARQTTDAFFTRFAELLASEAVPAAPPAIRFFDMIPREPFGYPLIGWVGAVLCLAILILLFGSSL